MTPKCAKCVMLFYTVFVLSTKTDIESAQTVSKKSIYFKEIVLNSKNKVWRRLKPQDLSYVSIFTLILYSKSLKHVT